MRRHSENCAFFLAQKLNMHGCKIYCVWKYLIKTDSVADKRTALYEHLREWGFSFRTFIYTVSQRPAKRTLLREGRANAPKVAKVSGVDIAGENGLGGRGGAR